MRLLSEALAGRSPFTGEITPPSPELDIWPDDPRLDEMGFPQVLPRDDPARDPYILNGP